MLESKKEQRAFSQRPLSASVPAQGSADLVHVGPANAGDHALIHRLLIAAQQHPSLERYSAWLEDPYCDPSDRILLRLGNQIIGHVHITNRTAYWGGERIVSAGLFDLVALPEYEPAGTGELLVAAEDQLREEGVVLAITRTSRPELYERLGWISLRREGFSRAGAHDIVAHLTAQPQAEMRERKYCVRMWRHIELDKLAAVYSQVMCELFGPVCRSEKHWHWLVGRKDHDFILLAEGPRPRAVRGGERPCVGFAVVRQDRVIELVSAPGHEAAAVSLLTRACREIVERGFHTVSLLLPVEHPLHEMLMTAGGQWCSIDNRPPGRLICKVFQFDRYVERMFAVFHRRARAAALSLPCRIAMDVDGRSMLFALTRRSARFEREASPVEHVPRIRCSMDDLQRLLVGRLDVRSATERGTLLCSGATAEAAVRALFSPLHVWQSLWDSPCW
jgi:predicted N-acetyltransferase YhbS